MPELICPHCHQQHPPTARFCHVTGRPINQPGPQPGLQPLVVPQPVVQPVVPNPVGGMTGQIPPNSFLNNRYIIQQRIGKGGMAAVYRAIDIRTNAVLAIKEMSDSISATPADRALALQSFQREATLLATLKHPNLPLVTDAFQEGNKHYLVMEFVEGATLGSYLESQGRPFDEPSVIGWAIQLCDVLSYLHAQNPPIIFRDLKPDNIMVTPSGQVKLIDFGIARFFIAGKAKDTQALGTIGYAAPEASAGQTDCRSDIFSLCVTMYHLLTGFDPTDKPFHLPAPRQVNPRISAETEQILQCGSDNRPDQRFCSAAELRSRLVRLLSSQTYPPGLAPMGVPQVPAGQKRSGRPTTRLLMAAVKLSTRQILGILGGVLAVLVIAAWFLTPVFRKMPIDWNLFPIFALFGPMAYAAYPRRGVAFFAHALLTTTLIVTISLRANAWFTGEDLAIGAVISGLFLEVWLALLPRIKGQQGPEAWKRELAWYAGMGAPFVLMYYYLIDHGIIGMNPIAWLFGSVFTGIAWFLGDLINQFLLYRQTGLRRKT